MLKTTNYQKPISEDLSKHLRNFITTNDIANVATEVSMSIDYIKKLLYRTANLTENNEKIISELTKVAIANCSKKIEEAKQASKFFNKNIKLEAA